MKRNRDILSRKDKLRYIPLRDIQPNPHQPRRKFNSDELNELAASIRENGVLQPITVRVLDGVYYLIAGERRLRAAHMAGLCEIPCVIVNVDDRQSATLAMLENLQRSDLGFFEEAAGIERLMRTCGYTQEEAARKLGKSQSAVSNKLRLLKLPGEVISEITEGGLTERHARALLRLNTRELQLAAVRHIREKRMNVFETDEYIDLLLSSRRGGEREASKRRYVIKDVRLFYNTVNRAIDTMRRSGLRAELHRNESDTAINMSITIFK